MTGAMRNLVAGGIATVVAGVPAVFWAIRPGTTQPELVAAGLTTDYTPRRVACTVRIGGSVDDGGYREVRPIIAVSNTLDAQGRRDILWPPKAVAFRDQVADVDQNCRTVQVMTWAAAAAEFQNDDPPENPGSCACWNPAAGDCVQSDGGTRTRDGKNEFRPGDFVGPGCRLKPCGEIAGFPSMPAECR